MEILRTVGRLILPMMILGLIIPGHALCAVPAPESSAAAKAMNAFAIDLYGRIRKPDGNLVYSPYSISMCLAMAYAGARGNTESQIAKALHLTIPQPKVSEAFSKRFVFRLDRIGSILLTSDRDAPRSNYLPFGSPTL